MKRIVRLTESDLARIVRRVINEAPTDTKLGMVKMWGSSFRDVYAPNEKVTFKFIVSNFSDRVEGVIFSAKVTVTDFGKKLGLKPENINIPLPVKAALVTKESNQTDMYGGIKMKTQKTNLPFTFTTPSKSYINNTGQFQPMFEVEFSTSDAKTPNQKVSISMGPNAQFGNAAAGGN